MSYFVPRTISIISHWWDYKRHSVLGKRWTKTNIDLRKTELEMSKKLLNRRSSTPVPTAFAKRPSLERRLTAPGRLEITWETLSNEPRTQNQESPKINKELKLPEIAISQNGINCESSGHSKLDPLGKTKLTDVRKLSLPDNVYLTAKQNLTSQRQNNVQGEWYSLQRQTVWNKACREHCKALRQFITNAEATFDSSKEKAMILSNWMSSQALPVSSWDNV